MSFKSIKELNNVRKRPIILRTDDIQEIYDLSNSEKRVVFLGISFQDSLYQQP